MVAQVQLNLRKRSKLPVMLLSAAVSLTHSDEAILGLDSSRPAPKILQRCMKLLRQVDQVLPSANPIDLVLLSTTCQDNKLDNRVGSHHLILSTLLNRLSAVMPSTRLAMVAATKARITILRTPDMEDMDPTQQDSIPHTARVTAAAEAGTPTMVQVTSMLL